MNIFLKIDTKTPIKKESGKFTNFNKNLKTYVVNYFLCTFLNQSL